ncbi:MAG: c-type cytochrome domain-containing protein [Chitinophagaceae bacterium]
MHLSITEFLGRFHPVLVHLPIGILLMALLLQWLSRKQQYTVSHDIMKVMWMAGAVTAVLSCITGYLLSLSGDYDLDTVSLHMWLGIGVAAVAVLISAKIFIRQFDLLYKIASVTLLILVLSTGHLGGSLTHGSDYLTAAWRNEPDTVAAQKIISNIQEATVYADVVQPMFQSTCYGCHGPKKQKGKLRLDDPEGILKGGKDGEVIVPGKAAESELIKRLLLPREDEDHMPPKQKPQLNERQVALLHWWIEQGADFTKKVKDLSQPEKIKPLLSALQGKREEKAVSSVPVAAVMAADEKAMQLLRDKGVVVVPVAQNSNYLMANFVTAPGFSDADMHLLRPLSKQLLWLKLSGANIGDSAMQTIGQCTNLSLLQLNGTRVTDKGLPFINSLNNLQSLSLVGTPVTVSGLLSLQSLKLASVYLYQTGVQQKDWEILKKAFPKTMLDTGGYSIPFMASDTAEVKAPVKASR